MNKEINETFEMFKDYVYSPELKELIASIQVMYNQKEELQQRIDKAIEYIENTNRLLEYQEIIKIRDILRGEDNEN